MAIIEFDKVRFSYDGERAALDGLALHIQPGSFVCVLGGNGSGKSTLAKHINALLVPDSGQVRVLGRDTADPANTLFIRGNAGMVFQNPDDQIVASVIENDVAFGPENLGVPTDELRKRVTAALAQVGLQGFEKKQTEALSGGQKQRVAVAGVLAMHPQILVLDEASAMLDPRGRAGLLRVCRELNDTGLTIVLITHFMEEAALADRVIALEDGAVALDGTPDDVLLQAERLASLALDVPFATSMSTALRTAGVPIGLHTDETALERELVALLQGDVGHAGESGVRAQGSNADEPAGDSRENGSGACKGKGNAPGGASGSHEKAGDIGKAESDAHMISGTGHEGERSACRKRGEPPEGEDARISLHDDGQASSSTGDAAGHTSGTPAIAFEHVSFTYRPMSQKRHRTSLVAPRGKQADWGRSPDEYWALEDVSFSVNEGEFFGIAGHTGSGKSTLIQLANGLLKPAAGTVRVRGRALDGAKSLADARAHIGVVFQYPEHQLFAATVFDDVAFGPRNLGFSPEQIEQAVNDALRMVHLDGRELRDRNPFELSGGQQRRVAFAGVLAMQPHTLVLDEPVAGLDPRAKRRFLQLLVELREQQGLTMVVVSHNMDDLAEHCDRLLVLNEGRLFALGSPRQVFADEQRLRSVGLGVPHATHLANRLAQAGIALPVGAVPSAEELAGAIAAQFARTRGGR